jgi:hypothetical protein
LSGVETSFSDESGHFDSAQCPDLVNPEQILINIALHHVPSRLFRV